MNRWLERQQMLAEEKAFEAMVADPAIPVETIDEAKVYTPNLRASEYKPGDPYKWKKGDNLTDVARIMGVTTDALREYNEIEEWNELEPGIVIYKPVPAKAEPKRTIRFEMLQTPTDYHVKTSAGAKKWRFGGAPCPWEGITATGFFPQNTNVRVLAVAYVPIEDETDPNMEAAYYMDSIALGDFAETGRVKYTVGFMHSDLEEGIAIKVVPEPTPEPAPVVEPPKLIPVQTEEPQPAKKAMDIAPPKRKREDFYGTDKAFIEERTEDILARKGYDFMETYQRLDYPTPVTAFIPDDVTDPEGGIEDGRKFVWIHDFTTNRPDRKLYQHWEGNIIATFEYKGVLYGRPEKSAEKGLWFGLPMDLLESQARLYNEAVDTETKIVTGRGLSLFERRFWVPLTKWTVGRKNKNKKG